MSQSKLLMVVPVVGITTLGGIYSKALEKNPLATKAFTSGFMSALGNIIGQRIKLQNDSDGRMRWRSVAAFGAFGFLVAGPVTHFWLDFLQRFGPANVFMQLFLDRFIYGPLMLLVTLYLLSIFQGTSFKDTRRHVNKMYGNAFKANLKIYLICQYVNLNFVPLQVMKYLYIN
ncbi:unnamed protein product [Allacma fusca]|uniref:Uncharacterized protein n=1 Tax=Allacma fusca TaxID=39272 RepID=A0A8J2Q2S0_9HEXA|nr:unnamed protein product [Allacma fusca]